MKNTSVTILGKAVRTISKMRGGGSALPGLVVEKIDANYVPSMLSQLPLGVVIVSGTNGKTTTTKMVVELLESQRLRVFTNRTGSNFVRGVAAAIISEASLSGTLRADIAVLELDEAHAVQFVKVITPRYSLLLNVMRDQLDRFGEIDTTAKMLEIVAKATSDTVVINREDPRLHRIGKTLPPKKAVYYGLATSLTRLFPSDDTMRGGKQHAPHSASSPTISSLEKISNNTATFKLHDMVHETTLLLDGIYNVYNATGALAVVAAIMKDKLSIETLFSRLKTITPAFGRGEKLTVNGQPLELVLVKNPGGFRLGLQSFSPAGFATMIAINDNYADGRDMSWLWDVDFDSLHDGVAMISGIRAYDMALRLQYDEVPVGQVEPKLSLALNKFITAHPTSPKRIYCTYTAMLALRKELENYTDVEKVL